jgi:hypothetical protein
VLKQELTVKVRYFNMARPTAVYKPNCDALNTQGLRVALTQVTTELVGKHLGFR